MIREALKTLSPDEALKPREEGFQHRGEFEVPRAALGGRLQFKKDDDIRHGGFSFPLFRFQVRGSAEGPDTDWGVGRAFLLFRLLPFFTGIGA